MPKSIAQKRWNAANPERVRAAKARYTERNQERLKQESRLRYARAVPISREKARLYAASFRRTLEGNPRKWLKQLLNSVKHRALRLGVPFELSVADVETPEHCPVLGVKLTYGAPGHGPHNPSLDRIIPGGGYVKGNVRIISHIANSCRQNCVDATVFRALALDTERLFGPPHG